MKKFLKISLGFIVSFSLFFAAACSGGAGNNGQINGETPPPSDPSSPSDPAESLRWDVSATDISHIGENRRLIAFTFDDGPTEKTNDLLDVFASFNEANPDCTAHATLFTIGARVSDENAQILTRAVSMNFELGNHTFTHTDLTALSDGKAKEELQKTDDVLKSFDGKAVHLVRPQADMPIVGF